MSSENSRPDAVQKQRIKRKNKGLLRPLSHPFFLSTSQDIERLNRIRHFAHRDLQIIHHTVHQSVIVLRHPLLPSTQCPDGKGDHHIIRPQSPQQIPRGPLHLLLQTGDRLEQEDHIRFQVRPRHQNIPANRPRIVPHASEKIVGRADQPVVRYRTPRIGPPGPTPSRAVQKGCSPQARSRRVRGCPISSNRSR